MLEVNSYETRKATLVSVPCRDADLLWLELILKNANGSQTRICIFGRKSENFALEISPEVPTKLLNVSKELPNAQPTA